MANYKWQKGQKICIKLLFFYPLMKLGVSISCTLYFLEIVGARLYISHVRARYNLSRQKEMLFKGPRKLNQFCTEGCIMLPFGTEGKRKAELLRNCNKSESEMSRDNTFGSAWRVVWGKNALTLTDKNVTHLRAKPSFFRCLRSRSTMHLPIGMVSNLHMHFQFGEIVILRLRICFVAEFDTNISSHFLFSIVTSTFE